MSVALVQLGRGIDMNKEQLNFVMDLLNIIALNRRQAIQGVIINGDSAYSVELFGDLPKNTINRDALRCSKKWNECLRIAIFVRKEISGDRSESL